MLLSLSSKFKDWLDKTKLDTSIGSKAQPIDQLFFFYFFALLTNLDHQVSLDFLVGKSSMTVKDESMLERLEDIAALPKPKRLELFNVLDAYIRDFKTSRSYAQ